MIFALARPAGRFAAILIAGLGLAGAGLAEGRFSAPERNQALAAGETVEVRWSAPCPDTGQASESELLLSLDGGSTFPIRVTPEMPACARGFRWRVPAVESSRARLALRSGSGEESPSERLEIVSDEFTIVAAEDDEADDLVPGPREIWTRQALEGDGAEELPLESMAGVPERLVAPDVSTEINEPTSSGLAVPSSVPVALCPSGRPTRALAARRAASTCAASVPLRL